MSTEIRVTKQGHVATLALSSEDGLHVLGRPTLEAILSELEALTHDGGLRALVITGGGTRAFSAGADLRELAKLDHERALAYAGFGQGVAKAIARFPVVTIAALNGPAYGGGIELALACDFRVAAGNFVLQYQAARLGLLPGWGGTQRLPRLIGPARAKAMMLLSRPVPASEGLAWGLLDAVGPDALAGFLGAIDEMEAHAAVQIKRAIDWADPGDFAAEREAFAACFADGRTPQRISEWLDARAKAPGARS